MDYAIQLVIAVFGANALFTFVQFLIERHDKKQDTPEKTALRALCEDRLGVLLRDWLHSDTRLAGDWRIISNLYDGYTALEGNGEIKVLYKEASEIKTTE